MAQSRTGTSRLVREPRPRALNGAVRSAISNARALAVLCAYAARERVAAALASPPGARLARVAVHPDEDRFEPVPPAVALARRVEEPRVEAPLEVHVEVAPPAIDRAELLRTIAYDSGCAIPGGSHDACNAARAFGGRPLDADAVRALEATVLQSGRPTCVQRAAVETLADAPTADSRRALFRMRDVVEERALWEGSHAPLLSVLRALPAG